MQAAIVRLVRFKYIDSSGTVVVRLVSGSFVLLILVFAVCFRFCGRMRALAFVFGMLSFVSAVRLRLLLARLALFLLAPKRRTSLELFCLK